MMENFCGMENLVYYCNGLGARLNPDRIDSRSERYGFVMLDDDEQLPQPLQKAYDAYWTDCLSVYCYVVRGNGDPGILLVAEYNLNEAQTEDQRLAICKQAAANASTMESVAKKVCPGMRLLLGQAPVAHDHYEMSMLIPVEAELEMVRQLYYLMDQYAFDAAPAEIDIADYQVFCKRLSDTIPESPLAGGVQLF